MNPRVLTGSKVRLALCLILPIPPIAHSAALPPGDDAMHLGVASCASSVCHGAADAKESGNVLQNEYLTWQREDPHAGSYQTLLNDESIAIAKRLGLGQAESEPLCLGCHTDNAIHIGEKFRRDDGIGCETCHGGAEKWLEYHATAGRKHAANLADGLYPLENPAARARLCQSCHVGGDQRPMHHELLGAGHPPLMFELDTFSAILPQHHRIDADYRERKDVARPIDFWIAGQLEHATRRLAALGDSLGQNSAGSRSELWPELSNYNCQSCHHVIGSDPARPIQPERSGLPTMRTAPMQALADIAEVLGVSDDAKYRAALEELHSQPEQSGRTLVQLQASFANLRSQLVAHPAIDRATWQQLLLAMTETDRLQRGLQGREQLDIRVMSIGVLLHEGRQQGWLTGNADEHFSSALDHSYSLLQDPHDFNAYAVRLSLARLNRLAEKLD